MTLTAFDNVHRERVEHAAQGSTLAVSGNGDSENGRLSIAQEDPTERGKIYFRSETEVRIVEFLDMAKDRA